MHDNKSMALKFPSYVDVSPFFPSSIIHATLPITNLLNIFSLWKLENLLIFFQHQNLKIMLKIHSKLLGNINCCHQFTFQIFTLSNTSKIVSEVSRNPSASNKTVAASMFSLKFIPASFFLQLKWFFSKIINLNLLHDAVKISKLILITSCSVQITKFHHILIITIFLWLIFNSSKENHDSEKGERLSIKSITKSKTQFCYKNYGAKKEGWFRGDRTGWHHQSLNLLKTFKIFKIDIFIAKKT